MKALIIGGGIGGLTNALNLHAAGIESKLVGFDRESVKKELSA